MARPAQILVVLALLAQSLAMAPSVYAAPPANDAFDRTWARTDAPVASGAAVRTWMWGPEAFTAGLDEPYLESPNLARTVQYFDKSRMELTDPSAPDDGLWYVTNGLLASELISGRMQIGNNAFVQLDPARVNVAGDPEDPTGPTYATFSRLLDSDPSEVGSLYTQRLDRDANVTTEPDLANRDVVAGMYDDVTQHTIAAPFWDFMNATGLVLEGSELVQGPLVIDPNYITGRPISEAYWSWVKVDGAYKDVLIQCFERRCLTYTPDNEPAWQVEAGNVGLHYHVWRYSSGQQYTVETVAAAEGGTMSLGEASLTIPAAALAGDTLASISIHNQMPDAPRDFVPVSPLYAVSVAGMALDAAVTLSLPFDEDAIPSDLTSDDLVVGRWDVAAGAWDLRSGRVDAASSTVSVTTGQLSFWQVFSPQSADTEIPPPPPPSDGPNPPTLPSPTDPIENLAPEAGDLAVEVDEDSSVDFTLAASDTDGDPLTYTVLTQPEHGSLSGAAPDLTYTSDANYFGTDSFTYKANDGEADSNTATVTITVRPVNDPPVAAGQTVNVPEDGSVAITLTAADIDSENLTFSVVDGPEFGTLSGTPPNVVYTPGPDYQGSDSFTFVANDGGLDSNVATVTLTVIAVNDAPTFTPGADVSVVEDSSAHTQAWATDISPGPTDEAGQTTVFEVSVTSGADLFSVQPSLATDGTLTFTPAADAFGTATVDVVLKDDGGVENSGSDTSAPHSLTIEILPRNDVPAFVAGPGITVLEDSGAYSQDWAAGISAGPANEADQTVSFEVVSNSNSALFSAGPAVGPDGVLTFTPAANANGSAEIAIRIVDSGGTDNGGTDTSATQTFTITVTPVNDAPTFNIVFSYTTSEDTGQRAVPGLVSAISPGPADEAGQTLTFEVTGNTNEALFSVQPAFLPDGTLTFTTAPNAFSTTTLTVVLIDSGGTDNGGQNTSVAKTMRLTVMGINDAPSFSRGPDVTVNEDSGAYSAAWATDVSAGPSNESGQMLTFEVTGNTNAALFSAGPAIDSSGVLAFTPAQDANGTATITIRLKDNGGTLNSGVDTSPAQSFTITLTPVNDAPVANDLSLFMNENGSALITVTGTDVDGDALTFSIISGPTSGFLVTTEEPWTCDGLTPGTCTWPVRYTPLPDFTGSASFTFQVNDGQPVNNLSNVATVSITVNNVAPVANDLSVSMNEDGSALITLTGTDASGDSLTFSIISQPAHGFLVTTEEPVTCDGLTPQTCTWPVRYTPLPDFNGSDSLTFQVNDGQSSNNLSNVATVSITVNPVSDVSALSNKGYTE